MSTRSTTRWYVVCSYTETRAEAGEVLRWPASTAHAKTVGSMFTACGRHVATWPRLYHVAFPTAAVENCRACLDAVR
jgi:hypothetical protein